MSTPDHAPMRLLSASLSMQVRCADSRTTHGAPSYTRPDRIRSSAPASSEYIPRAQFRTASWVDALLMLKGCLSSRSGIRPHSRHPQQRPCACPPSCQRGNESPAERAARRRAPRSGGCSARSGPVHRHVEGVRTGVRERLSDAGGSSTPSISPAGASCTGVRARRCCRTFTSKRWPALSSGVCSSMQAPRRR